MPISKQNGLQDANGGSKPQSSSTRQSPASMLRRRLGSHQKVAPQTNGVDQPRHHQHQRHVAGSHFGQQHHSSRPSAWVIPFEDPVQLPYNPTGPLTAALSSDGTETPPLLSDDEFPLVTPEGRTPCTSNTRKIFHLSGSRSYSYHDRGLHNSHRKPKLNFITPRETPQPIPTTAGFPEQYQQRGNGLVLDLTSLFAGDPSERSTPTQLQHSMSKSPVPLNYNAPTPPPWRRGDRAAAVTSPVTVSSDLNLSLGNMDVNNTSIFHDSVNREDLQWDTKSQTTQEALLTERQCQALTQWLNFVLVGEQTQDEYSAAKKKPSRRVGGSFDMDDDKSSWSRATTPTYGGRSRATTPSQSQRSTTPLSRSGQSTTASTSFFGTGRATPSVAEGRATPAASLVSDKTTQAANNNKRRNRRLSLFQYAESYEHAQDQGHHWFQHSAQWKELRRRIRMELAGGKLKLREDRNLYANVGCRDILLELFCSYKPAWLTLALEVVMDDTITPSQGHTIPTIKQLKQFIVHRVLMDEKLLSKYTQGKGSRTPSGKFEKAFQAELQPLVLYRILVLVFFLDRAAVKFQTQNNNLGNLFLAKSKVKSTAQVLVMICREFLSRQGDVIKQLARANMHVYYTQHRLDEIDYPIANFAVDLRDGVRLCRVVEVLWLLPRRNGYLLNNQNMGGGIDNVQKYPLLHQLRIPAISRLQKIHNVNVALAALEEQCQLRLPGDLQAHHIVDGQRRMVMRLIWSLVLVHCFENMDLLTRKQVEKEIAQAQAARKHHKIIQQRRRQAQERQASLNILEREVDAVESVALVSTDGTRITTARANLSPMPTLPQSSSNDDEDDDNSTIMLLEMPVVQQWKGLLFRWCQEVCSLVDEQEKDSRIGAPFHPKQTQENWTSTDLANGKALCCLIHYYHPSILPLEDLRLASRVVDGPPIKIQAHSTTLTGKFRHMRHQRRSPNVAPDYYMRLAQRCLNEIGGIPPMMLLPLDKKAKNSQRKRRAVVALGEEKSLLVFLYHVCARLLESQHQVQSVVFVQQRYRYLHSVNLWRQQLQAGKIILGAWRVNKDNYFRNREQRFKRSVMVIEAFVARNFDKLLVLQTIRLERELRGLAVTPIQALVRRFLSNSHLHSMLERQAAAVTIQAKFRQFHEYHTYQILLLEVVPATAVIQRHWRGFAQRTTYSSIINATITLQTFLRTAGAVRMARQWNSGATCIQRIWRGFWVQLHYQMDLLDIIAVQCMVRKQQAIQYAQRKARAVDTVQYAARGFLARAMLDRKRRELAGAITIQIAFRVHVAVKELARLRAEAALLRATIVVQRAWRWAALRAAVARLHAACVIQRSWHRAVFLRDRQRAAVVVQTQFRMWSAHQTYSSQRLSAQRIETQWRQFTVRKMFMDIIEKVTLMQSCVRRWQYGVVELKRRKAAIATVQTYAQRWLAVRLLKAMKQRREDTIRSAIVCQTLTRRNSCLRAWKKARLAVLVLQCVWRRYWRNKIAKRKEGLISALSSCDLLFRHLQKGTFKIIPHKRQIVPLSKQKVVRCGKKRIALSNAATWVVPWKGHRQKLFRHRSHVKAVRLKYNSGVQLHNLPRRSISLSMLKIHNEAAMRLQAPWTYLYLHRCGAGGPGRRGATKERLVKHNATRRFNRAKRAIVASVQSTVKRSVNADDPTLSTSYQQDIKSIRSKCAVIQAQLRSPKQRLVQKMTTARVLSLVHRNTHISVAKKTSGELFEDPFKRKHQLAAAAKIVQKNWRCCAAKKYANATRIQAVLRGHMVRGELQVLHDCAVIVQGRARGYIARKGTEKLVKAMKDSKIVAQKQATERSHRPQQDTAKSVVCVQSAVRRWCARRLLQQLLQEKLDEIEREAAVRIQKSLRRFNCRRRWLTWRQRRQRAAATVIVQRHVRGFLVRQELSLQHFACTEIQRVWRGYQDSIGYIFVIISVIKCQSFLRMAIAKKARQELELARMQTHVSATRIQSLCRRMSAQKLASDAAKMRNLRRQFATKIQAAWRMTMAIQRTTKLVLAKQGRQNGAALKLQCLARVAQAKTRKAKLSEIRALSSPPQTGELPVTPVRTEALPVSEPSPVGEPNLQEIEQEDAPAKPSFPVEELNLLRIELDAPLPATQSTEELTLPKVVSDVLPAAQSVEDPKLAKKGQAGKLAEPHDVLHRRLSLSQGVVRGFLARRQSNAEVRKSIILIKEAELRSRLHPSMRLGARMEKALKVLTTSSNLTEVMNVVCTIELATRFSEECCVEFVEAGAVGIVIALLYDLNKSLPHVELLYYLMRTLFNICRHRTLVQHVATVDATKAFSHLIRMYGSEDAVFCSAVSLLEICAAHNKEVRALLATPSSKKRMEGICKQWERKLDRRLKLSTPQKKKAVSPIIVTPTFMSKRNKAKTDMLILGISYDLQNGVKTFRQVLSRTI